MKVHELHAILSLQIAQGHGGRTVGIDLDTLSESAEDGFISGIETASAEWIADSDGDGCTVRNADGSERGQTMIILSGR